MEVPVTALVLCELAPAERFGVPSLSPFCAKVHRALAVARLPYERRHGAHPGVFKPHNPTGQVPVLLEGDRAIADSTPIVRRIVELAPGALDTSPEQWLWEELADTSLNGFLVAARWADEDNWPAVSAAYFEGMPWLVRQLVPRKIRKRVLGGLHARDVWRAGPEACWSRLEGLLDQLDARAPERGYWCGDRIGVGDVALWAQLRSLRTPLTPRQSDSVGRRTRLAGWMERVEAA